MNSWLPRLHKPNVALHPIASLADSATYNLHKVYIMQSSATFKKFTLIKPDVVLKIRKRENARSEIVEFDPKKVKFVPVYVRV